MISCWYNEFFPIPPGAMVGAVVGHREVGEVFSHRVCRSWYLAKIGAEVWVLELTRGDLSRENSSRHGCLVPASSSKRGGRNGLSPVVNPAAGLKIPPFSQEGNRCRRIHDGGPATTQQHRRGSRDTSLHPHRALLFRRLEVELECQLENTRRVSARDRAIGAAIAD